MANFIFMNVSEASGMTGGPVSMDFGWIGFARAAVAAMEPAPRALRHPRNLQAAL
jgi:hypothetical protein